MEDEEYEGAPKMIRVIMKEPNREPVVREIENTYRNISDFCEGLIDITTLPTDPEVDVIVNDESLMNGMEANLAVPELESVWAGPIMFTGYNPETGDSVSLSDEQVRKVMKYIERNQVHNMSLERAYLYSKVIGPLQRCEDELEMEA